MTAEFSFCVFTEQRLLTEEISTLSCSLVQTRALTPVCERVALKIISKPFTTSPKKKKKENRWIHVLSFLFFTLYSKGKFQRESMKYKLFLEL
jgi:hypothetical protein